MALPATDDLAGTGALSASWTQQRAFSITRVSGVAQTTFEEIGGVFWNADVFNVDNHYSKAQVFGLDPVNELVISVCSLGENFTNSQYYGFKSNGDIVKKFPDEAELVKATLTGFSLANGDVLGVVWDNPFVRVYVNGSWIGEWEDTGILLEGAAGFFIEHGGGGPTPSLDNWEGGNGYGGMSGGPLPDLQISGTMLDEVESTIVAGGTTIILTLTNDTWPEE